MEVISYFVGLPLQPLAAQVRGQLSQLLQPTGGEVTPEISQQAQAPLTEWFEQSVVPLVNTAKQLAASAGDSRDAYLAASDAVRIAGGDYLDWYGVADSFFDPAEDFPGFSAVTRRSARRNRLAAKDSIE